MKITLGYDVSILETDCFTGVEKLAYCLFKEFWNLYPEIKNIAFCRKTPERLSCDLPENTIVQEVPGGRFWRYIELPKALKSSSIDCFISPVAALPWQKKIPMLSYIHECQWRCRCGESGMLSHRIALWNAALRSRLFLTNSEFTCSEIQQELGRFCPDIVVAPPAGDSALKDILPASDDELFRKLGKELKKPFALFVSTVRAKKNVGLIVEAFKKPSMKDTDIIIAGKIKDRSFVDAANGHDNIIFTDYVDDKILKALYLKAGVFVYVSLNEGFGLPILEAFQHDLPVIGVKKASIPEVAGDGALLIDDLDPDKLAENVLKVLSQKDLAEKLRKGMRKQLEKYTWTKSAKQLRSAIDLAFQHLAF